MRSSARRWPPYTEMVKALRTPGVQLIICERSVWSDKHIFAEVNLSDVNERAGVPPRATRHAPLALARHSSEITTRAPPRSVLAAYAASHAALCDAMPPVRLASILLDAPVEVLIARVSARARVAETDGEGCGIPTEYLERLQALAAPNALRTPGPRVAFPLPSHASRRSRLAPLTPTFSLPTSAPAPAAPHPPRRSPRRPPTTPSSRAPRG